MRHYVVVFLESGLFPGTWVTDHFVRREERENIAPLPDVIGSHERMLQLLKEWQNEDSPKPSWTLEEVLLAGVAQVTVLFYMKQHQDRATRIVTYRMEPMVWFD